MKKFFALFLVMIMALSMVSIAFAENETTAVNDTVEDVVDDTPVEEVNETVDETPVDEVNETVETPVEVPVEEETPTEEGNETVEEEVPVEEGNATIEEEVEISEEEVADAGTTPDSFLWNLDLALEKIDLLLTFDEATEAQKELEYARERLLEAQVMVSENNVEAAEEAQVAHDELMEDVEETIEALGNGDGEQELAEEIALEEQLNQHRMLVQKVNKNMLKTKGLTAEQQTQTQAMFESMAESTEGVKVQIQVKKNKTKIKIKAEKGMSDEEINALEEQVRAMVGEGAEVKITGHKPKKAKKEKGVDTEDDNEADESDDSEETEGKDKGKPEKEDKGKPDKEDKGKPDKEDKGKKK